jgi:hypothetical protein
MEALGDAFLAAQLRDAVAAQAFEHDVDLVLGREMTPGLSPAFFFRPEICAIGADGGQSRRRTQRSAFLLCFAFFSVTRFFCCCGLALARGGCALV